VPTYDYRCSTHGRFEAFGRMKDDTREAPCPSCGVPAGKVFLRPTMIVSEERIYTPYECPVTGKMIGGSRRAHEENLKRHGCHVYEAGETRDEERRREDNFNAQIDKAMEAVDKTAGELGYGV